jgi:hypothetical protein
METLLFESETIRKGPPYLALIVPYRDRPAHLVEFAPHMESFLKDIEFRLMLIEQADNKPFNRGKLLNIGFTLAREEASWMCFHDVDIIHFRNTQRTWRDVRNNLDTRCLILSIWAAFY